MNVAAFEGFCIRLTAAILAADRAQVSLAEALALWRTEGDLVAPYSEGRRAAGAPTYDVIKNIALGDRTADVLFTMSRGMWSGTFSSAFPGEPLPTTLAQMRLKFDGIKLRAFAEWSLVLAGVDRFWQKIAVDLGNRTGTLNDTASFFDRNHVALFGGASAVAARKAECNDILDNFIITATFGDLSERLIAAPNDNAAFKPWALVWVVLGEALIFQSLNKAAGEGPVVEPTLRLKYLAYHCQDHRHDTDPTQDKFTLMLISATVSAARTGPAGAQKTALQAVAGLPQPADLGTPDFTDPTQVLGDTANHQVAFTLLEAAGWWTSTANLDWLTDFMLKATLVQWGGFGQLRGNMIRFANLLAYYTKLLT
jgi:hypothetical protein